MSYLLEFFLLLSLFAIIYHLLLRNKSNYVVLRAYITGAFIASFYIPLLPAFITTKHNLSIVLPEVLIGTANGQPETLASSPTFLSVSNILFIIFVAITLLFVARFFWSFLKIVKVILNKKTRGHIIYSDIITAPCSFLNYILLPKEHDFSEEEFSAIIKHENLHIKHNHTIEKVLLEFIKSIFWWHPATYYLSQELSLIHEYQVDQTMSHEMEGHKYRDLLIKLVLQPHGLQLTSQISSNIKKRILMMNNTEKKLTPFLSLAIIATLFIGVMGIHACQNEQLSSDEDTYEVITEKGLKTVTKVETLTETTIDTLTVFDPSNLTETVSFIYNNPEVMPVFEGCDESLKGDDLKACSTQKLLQVIYKNLVYPKEAKDNNIEGMVLVKFIINEQGKIENRMYIKKGSHGLKESVDEVLDLMNDKYQWTPGKHNGEVVKVQFTLPVKFKLN